MALAIIARVLTMRWLTRKLPCLKADHEAKETGYLAMRFCSKKEHSINPMSKTDNTNLEG